MVVVSHLFFFFENNLGADVTHSSHIGLCLELSISRHPPAEKALSYGNAKGSLSSCHAGRIKRTLFFPIPVTTS